MWKKNSNWIYLNSPALILFVSAFLLPEHRKLILSIEGYCALALLITVLLLNPMISAFPTHVWLKKINRFRRILGVASFTYAAFHAALYIEKKGLSFFKWIIHPVILAGLLSILIFIPLAITSNNASVKKMGFNSWKKLHTKVYIAEVLIFIHMILQNGKTRVTAFIVFPIVWFFQYLRRRKKNQKAVLKHDI